MLGFVLIASFLTVLTGRALSAAQGGTGNGTSASRSQSRTSRSVTVNENGRQVSITENDEGISVFTSETIDGVEKKTEVRSPNVKELEAESPEAFELYKRHLRNANASATTRTGATTSFSRTLMQQSSSGQSATAGGSATSRGRAGTSLRSGGGSGTTAPGHAPLRTRAADVLVEIGGDDEFRPGVVKGLGLRAVDDGARPERHIGELLGGHRDEVPKHGQRGRRAIRKLDDLDAASMERGKHLQPDGRIATGEKRQGLLAAEGRSDRA